MKAYRCDRCGKYFDNGLMYKNKRVCLSIFANERWTTADLCDTCINSLDEWARKGRIYFTDEELEVMDEKDNK